MQFTGVCTDTGVKIWEGDVLREDFDFDGMRYSNLLHVTFHNGAFCFMHVGDNEPENDDVYYLNEFSKPIKDIVLGNRYEHPYLLFLTGQQPHGIGLQSIKDFKTVLQIAFL